VVLFLVFVFFVEGEILTRSLPPFFFMSFVYVFLWRPVCVRVCVLVCVRMIVHMCAYLCACMFE